MKIYVLIIPSDWDMKIYVSSYSSDWDMNIYVLHDTV